MCHARRSRSARSKLKLLNKKQPLPGGPSAVAAQIGDGDINLACEVKTEFMAARGRQASRPAAINRAYPVRARRRLNDQAAPRLQRRSAAGAEVDGACRPARLAPPLAVDKAAA